MRLRKVLLTYSKGFPHKVSCKILFIDDNVKLCSCVHSQLYRLGLLRDVLGPQGSTNNNGLAFDTLAR